MIDPACGTAGFLISAYKHILSQHDGKNADGTKNSEKPLTPDQRKILVSNFEGYDIDPGMVRISQVNMYLHQFKNPKIYQYDSLSNDERWGDKFDVILANPPFMSPQGGIRPHSKFGIQSSRSEVLFVDYIMSHLRPKGRAGIIVPEGVVFKNDSAYKQLRKNLVEDGLYAVVSLPSGVFNPYSGVKTNILLFDNEISKLTDGIIFIKIQNDGFDLGAQRREIEKNDLPIATSILIDYRNTLVKGKGSLGEIKDFIKHFDFSDSNVSVVSKKKISENDNYNLLGDRYKISDQDNSANWPMVRLEDVLDYEQPGDYIVESVDYSDDYIIPVLTAGKTFILGYTNEKDGIFQDRLPVIIFDDFTTATKFVDFPFKVKSSAMKILCAKKDKADIKYLFHVIQNIKFSHDEHKRYWISEYSKIKIPLPPLGIQKQIVKELNSYQKIIFGAQQVIENWKPRIDINPKWDRVKLGDVCEIYQPKTITSKEIKDSGSYKVFGANGVIGYYDKYNHENSEVLLTCRGATCGTMNLSEPKSWVTGNAMVISPKGKDVLDKSYLFFSLIMGDFSSVITGAAQPQITRTALKPFTIPLPSLDVQNQIVKKIESEKFIVESNKKLIDIYEKKIKEVIVKLWEK